VPVRDRQTNSAENNGPSGLHSGQLSTITVCCQLAIIQVTRQWPHIQWRTGGFFWSRSFTAHMPLLTAARAFRLGRRCPSSQWCYLHRFCTAEYRAHYHHWKFLTVQTELPCVWRADIKWITSLASAVWWIIVWVCHLVAHFFRQSLQLVSVKVLRTTGSWMVAYT